MTRRERELLRILIDVLEVVLYLLEKIEPEPRAPVTMTLTPGRPEENT